LLRYTQTLITQMAQTAVCNRHHSLVQQLCRWLLQSLDRLQTDHLVITQELIASMLGVRREGVTEAAGQLHKGGLIDYRRGHITVVDRAGLEQRACECYAVVKKELDRLLPPVAQAHEALRQPRHFPATSVQPIGARPLNRSGERRRVAVAEA
jgi:DNA-binding GntR family transcriptional regulator